jgi:hypothetical protein
MIMGTMKALAIAALHDAFKKSSFLRLRHLHILQIMP